MKCKIAIILLFITAASAQNFEDFILKWKSERNFVDNPCSDGRTGGHFARNSRGCSWYFACNAANEVIREDRCPGDLRFDYDSQKCDYEENVPCEELDVPQICPTTRGISVIPHPYSCSKFTVCFDGIQNDRECGDGKHFSYYDGKCVDPFLADCNLDAAICRESQETGNPVFISNSRDCGSYYVCVGKTSVPLFCAPEQHFLPEKNWCVPEDESECESVLPPDTPSIPDKISIDCEGATGVALPHPDACEFFFFCAGDRSYLQACGTGLVFDVNSGRCQVEGKCILDEDVGGVDPPIIEGFFRRLFSRK